MKRHANLSIFVPHLGCPHACLFCDQRNISGEQRNITPEDVRLQCERYLPEDGSKTEIAFFGGSFTAIDRELMISLLEAAYPFVQEGRACGIRCSTRPDAIDDEVLDILARYGVTSIELGAQSMSDKVLAMNMRGHDSDAVRRASALIRERGLSLGLQMMVGMYGDEDPMEGAVYTAREIISLSPDTVRIYPTIVVEGTALCSYYRSGRYAPLSVDDAVEICAVLISMFREKDINVIRVGLHYEDSLERTAAAGPFHPAFGELCESRIYRDELVKLTHGMTQATVLCSPRILSQVLGQKRSNIRFMSEMGIDVKVVPDAGTDGIRLG